MLFLWTLLGIRAESCGYRSDAEGEGVQVLKGAVTVSRALHDTSGTEILTKLTAIFIALMKDKTH